MYHAVSSRRVTRPTVKTPPATGLSKGEVYRPESDSPRLNMRRQLAPLQVRQDNKSLVTPRPSDQDCYSRM